MAKEMCPLLGVQVLQPPLGTVLVAAKSHYFGVGGGIRSFKKAVKQDGIFEVRATSPGSLLCLHLSP